MHHKQRYLISPPLPMLKRYQVTYFVFKDFLTLTNMLKKLSAFTCNEGEKESVGFLKTRALPINLSFYFLQNTKYILMNNITLYLTLGIKINT